MTGFRKPAAQYTMRSSGAATRKDVMTLIKATNTTTATNDKVMPLRQNERLGSSLDGSKGLIIGSRVVGERGGAIPKEMSSADGARGSLLHLDLAHFHRRSVQMKNVSEI